MVGAGLRQVRATRLSSTTRQRHYRFFLAAELKVDTELELPEPVFRHAIQVLRLRAGDRLVLFDGRGGEFRARLAAVERRKAVVRIEQFSQRDVESPLAVTLAQVIAKGDRMDYTLQKSVELGVRAIVPLFGERGVGQFADERLQRRLAHWSNVIAAACEQCGRNRLPALATPQPLASWMESAREPLKLMLAPDGAIRLQAVPVPSGPLALLIGPEGGFSQAECATATDAGFIAIALGPRVLRAETAGPAALAAMQALWGDLA